MAVVITHVDDLHKAEDGIDVTAAETVLFGLDGVEYSTDLDAEHADELRQSLRRYIDAVNKVGEPGKKKKSAASHHPVIATDTPLKAARRYGRRMRAFADSRPDLGETSYLTASGNISHSKRLRDAYVMYESEHGPYPLPDDPR